MRGRFNHVLCVLSGTHDQEEVVHQAIHVAKKHQANLTLLLALEALPPNAQMVMQSMSYMDSQKAMEVSASDWLKNKVSRWSAHYDMTSMVTVGSLHRDSVNVVVENKVDLVIKQAEEEILERFFGSEDIHLLRECPCPVWLTHAGQKKSYKNVVAAVDLNYHYEEDEVARRQSLNMGILRCATRVALLEFAQLHVVHVYDVLPDNALRDGFISVDESILARDLAITENERELELSKIIHSLESELEDEVKSFLKPQMYLAQGNPRIELALMAKQLDADALVMGTVGRSGLSGLVLGNTAEALVNQLNCGLIAVK